MAAKKTATPKKKLFSIKQYLPNLKNSKTKSKKTDDSKPYVPTMRSNLRRSRKIFKNHRKAVLKLTLIYGGLYFLLVRAITNLDLDQLRETTNLIFGNGDETFNSRAVLASTLFGESTNLDQSSGFYFAVIFFVNSLAIIWLLRHFWANKTTSVKEAYYQGMYPLVPMILVVMMIFLQSIPFSIGSYIMQTSFSNGIAVTLLEKLGIVSIFVAGLVISAYWIIGTIVSLYAVTVPGMTPIGAFRRSKEILRGRRFLVMRQAIIFTILTMLVALMIMLAVVYVWPASSIVAVTILIIIGLPWFHFYFYGLYRDLLDEKA